MLHTFLDFELDEKRCELRRDGKPVPTQGRVFDLIVYLLRERERVVSRDELMDALWDGNVVSDAAISQVIMQARKALGDEGDAQRVIKTLRGRGVRFAADVQSQNGPSEEPRSPRPAEPPPAAAASDTLLGRALELDTLRGRLALAEQGQGGLMLIEGDPGVGKTTLAEQLARMARERGFEVIWGRAWEDGGAPPFWPWIQVLRAIAEREGPERLRAWLGSGGSELSLLLPELGLQSAPRSDAPCYDMNAARTRFRLFDVLSRTLRQLCATSSGARTRPWLIILDDLHAADDGSVQLVRFLMPELRELGLLLVGTYRGLVCADKEALSSLVEHGAGSTLHLRGFLPTEVAELLSRRLGQTVHERLAAAYHRVSGGNPLLLSELCSRFEGDPPQALFELSSLSDFALPERIASAVRQHLVALPDDTRTALSAASALGREFASPQLAKVLGCSEAELSVRLAPAIRRGVLRATHATGRFLFSHALVCSTIYAELTPSERHTLHRTIAEQLEQAVSPALLPLHELAHHWYLAAADGKREKALLYLQEAAEQASAMMAHDTSAVLYERAIELLELEPPDSGYMHALLCASGMALYRSGEVRRAIARFDRAASQARREQAVERYAEAVALSGCVLRGVLLHETARQVQTREALALLPAGDSVMRARLLSISSLGMRSPKTLPERMATTQAAVDMARRLGDPEVLLWALDAQHFVLWGAAPPQEMVLIAREMVELSRRTQNIEVLLDALLWAGYDYCEMGDLAALLRVRDAYLSAVESYPSPWHRYMALGADVLQAMVLGDVQDARRLSQEMVEMGRRVQDGLAETFFAMRTMFFDLWQAVEQPIAESPYALIDPPVGVAADYRAFWALSFAQRGYVEVARSMLMHTLHHEQELLDPLRRPLLSIMAEVAVTLNDQAACQEAYRLLLPESGRHLILQAYIYLGPVDHYLGMLASALDLPAMREHFDHALSESMCPASTAQTQYHYGRALKKLGDARARELLAASLNQTERLGFEELARRARSELRGLP